MTVSLPQKVLSSLLKRLESEPAGQLAADCLQLVEDHPTFAEGWYFLFQIKHQQGEKERAEEFLRKALDHSPLATTWKLDLCALLWGSGRLQEARTLAFEMMEKPVKDVSILDALARLMAKLDCHAYAKVLYLQALELDPDNSGLHYNLATAQRFLGEIDAAEKSLDKVLSANPLDHQAQHLRSGLRQQTREANHIQELETLLQRNELTPAARVHLGFALAKELEDLQDYDKSFAALAQGARIRRQHLRYAVDRDVDIMTEIRKTFDRTLLAEARTGCERPGPIFILGMPRTGTTLVERILASHSRVASLGETNGFAEQMVKQVDARHDLAVGSLIARAATLDWATLGEAYLQSCRQMTASEFHINKLPFNYLYLGLIHLALPQARIIHLQRHPMDTCYAVYKQLFNAAYPFSYDLGELGQYYLAYHELMRHWHSVLPGVIHTVHYEAVIEDSEREARRLLDFCGLEWEPQCLAFHEHQAPSTTASATQVRQPLYSSSVGKWRHYQRQLQPLREMLEGNGISCP